MPEGTPSTPGSKEEAQDGLANANVKRGVYKHYKGGLYIVYGMSVKEDTLEPLVHYYSMSKQSRWTRTSANFCAYVPPLQYARFVFVREARGSELLVAAGLEEFSGRRFLPIVF